MINKYNYLTNTKKVDESLKVISEASLKILRLYDESIIRQETNVIDDLDVGERLFDSNGVEIL